MSVKMSVGNRRRKRLFIAPDIAAPVVFGPKRKDWQRIENAFGVRLSTAHRTEIIKVVDNYFFVHELERSAPFANDAIAWLKKLKTRLNQTLSVVSRKPNTTSLQREAENCARTWLMPLFGEYRGGERWTWPGIQGVIVDLERACVALIRDFETSEDGFKEGAAWKLLICELTKLAERDSLPALAGKGDKTSPFVKYIRELQKTFPSYFQKHLQSDNALAEAISKARRHQKTNAISKA